MFFKVYYLILFKTWLYVKAYLDDTLSATSSHPCPSNTVAPQGTLLPLFPATEGVATIKFNC